MTDAPTSAAPKKISPLLKLALELGPLIIFFVTFQRLNNPDLPDGDTQALIWSTGVFMAALAVAMGVTWALTRSLSRVAILTAVIVAVMGTLTIILEDGTFIKMKPTIVNALFAAALGFGLLQGRSYLKYLMDELMPLDDAGWMKLTRNWMLFFVALAVLNEIVWRGFSTETWLSVKTFVNPILSILFIFTQAPLLNKHSLEGKERG